MALGNLLGLGGSSSKTGSGNNTRNVIRNVDFEKSDFKNRIRSLSPLKAYHEERIKKNGRTRTKVVKDVIAKNKVEHISRDGGRRVVDNDYNDNILKVVKGAVKSGQTISSWKRNLREKNQLNSVSKEKKITYHIRGDKMNREKRGALSKIFDPLGPSKKEIQFTEKKKARFKKLNIFQTNRARDEAEKLKTGRSSGGIRSKIEEDKAHYDRIGAKGKKYKISSTGAVLTSDKFQKEGQVSGASQSSYAEKAKASSEYGSESAASIVSGIGAKPQEKDNVIEVDFNKKKESFSSDIL